MDFLPRKELHAQLKAAGCDPPSNGRPRTRKDLHAQLKAAGKSPPRFQSQKQMADRIKELEDREAKRSSSVARAIVTQNKADRAAVKAKVLTATAKPAHPALTLSAELDQAWEEYHSAPDAWTRKKVFEQHRSLIMNTGEIRKRAEAVRQNSKTN